MIEFLKSLHEVTLMVTLSELRLAIFADAVNRACLWWLDGWQTNPTDTQTGNYQWHTSKAFHIKMFHAYTLFYAQTPILTQDTSSNTGLFQPSLSCSPHRELSEGGTNKTADRTNGENWNEEDLKCPLSFGYSLYSTLPYSSNEKQLQSEASGMNNK